MQNKNEPEKVIEQSTLVPTDEINSLYESADKNMTYLIFSVGKKFFSIQTLLVKEILHSAKIHPLPFVPDYIEGVVNCHGTPFTVVNPLKILDSEEKEIEGGTVLLFKREDDNFAIHISNIEVFFEVEEQDILDEGIRFLHAAIRLTDAILRFRDFCLCLSPLCFNELFVLLLIVRNAAVKPLGFSGFLHHDTGSNGNSQRNGKYDNDDNGNRCHVCITSF